MAAAEPSLRYATGGGQQWAECMLHTCRLNADCSAIRVESTTRLSATTPRYLTVAITRAGEQMLYAISGEEISCYSIGYDGKLALRGSAPTGSDRASHLCTDDSKRPLYTANYGSGTVSLLPIAEDGALGKAKVYSHGLRVYDGAKGSGAMVHSSDTKQHILTK